MNQDYQNAKDRYPLYCLTFSPNWNSIQIISFNSKGLFAYGCNAEIFIIDSNKRSFITSLSCPFLKKSKDNKPIKVTALFIDEAILIGGFSDGTIAFWSLKVNYELIVYEHVSDNQITHIIQSPKFNENMGLIVSDEVGKIFELKINGSMILYTQLKEKIKGPILILKIWLNNTLIILYKDGVLEILHYETKQILYEYDFKMKLVHGDYIIIKHNNTLQFGLMSKKSTITICELISKTQNTILIHNPPDLNNNNKNELTCKSSSSCNDIIFDLKIVINTKLSFQINPNQKNDKDVLKAIHCVKFLDENMILITGLSGEIFLLPIKYLIINTNIILKHLSADFSINPPYIVQENNPHFKYIYHVMEYMHQDQKYLLTLSIDRKLIFWKYDMKNIECGLINVWDINFLGGKINALALSDLEKNKIFMACNDHSFRIWNLDKKNNHFSNQYVWKYILQNQIKGLICHPIDEGLISYYTDDNRICYYDLYNLTCLKILKLKVNIKKIMWIATNHIEIFQKIKKLRSSYILPNVEKKVKNDLINTNKRLDKEEVEKEEEEGELKEYIKLNDNNKLIQEKIEEIEFKQEKIPVTATITIEKSKNYEYKDCNYYGNDQNNNNSNTNIYTIEKCDTKNYTKILNTDYSLLILLDNNTFLIWTIHENHIDYINVDIMDTITAYDIKAIKDTNILISCFGTNKGDIKLLLMNEDMIKPSVVNYKGHNHIISSLRFNQAMDSNKLLCATSGYDRKILISKINIADMQANLSKAFIPIYSFKTKARVLDIKWSRYDYLLAIFEQDKTVQIWNCIYDDSTIPISNADEKTIGREICNIRGHDGFITDADFSLQNYYGVITASDDQTVKIWDINTILYKTIPNKKKNKNKNRKAKATQDKVEHDNSSLNSNDDKNQGNIQKEFDELSRSEIKE